MFSQQITDTQVGPGTPSHDYILISLVRAVRLISLGSFSLDFGNHHYQCNVLHCGLRVILMDLFGLECPRSVIPTV